MENRAEAAPVIDTREIGLMSVPIKGNGVYALVGPLAAGAPPANGTPAVSGTPAASGSMITPPHEIEVGLPQIVRDLHRALTRSLQTRVAAHGVSMGQWFFLRALWEQDGVTQRELSQRVGMMEPTTVTALNGMERRGLVQRVRNPHDRRKVNIFLTAKGRNLRDALVPCTRGVNERALTGIDPIQASELFGILRRMTANLGLPAHAFGDDPGDDLD